MLVFKSPRGLHVSAVFTFRVFEIQSLSVPAQRFTAWTLLDFKFWEWCLQTRSETNHHIFVIDATYNAQLVLKIDSVSLQ